MTHGSPRWKPCWRACASPSEEHGRKLLDFSAIYILHNGLGPRNNIGCSLVTVTLYPHITGGHRPTALFRLPLSLWFTHLLGAIVLIAVPFADVFYRKTIVEIIPQGYNQIVDDRINILGWMLDVVAGHSLEMFSQDGRTLGLHGQDLVKELITAIYPLVCAAFWTVHTSTLPVWP